MVHLFIDRARQLYLLKDPAMIRNNLRLSLRVQASEWWTRRSETEQCLVSYGKSVDEAQYYY